jgi:putative ABC transport system permease protein
MMGAVRNFAARLRYVFQRSRGDRDFEQELQSHVEMLTDDNIARGMTPEQARRAATLKVGPSSSLTIRHRDARGLPWLEDLIQDVTFAGRLIARDKWFSAAAIIVIALGIGANAVGFTIVNAACFSGFGFDRADQLHIISWRPDRGRRIPSSYADLEDWRSQSRSFSAISAYQFEALNIGDDHAPPQQTQGAHVTANFFEVLREQPVLGRGFAAGDDRRGGEPLVLIGYELWTNRYGRDPNVIGRVLRVSGTAATIIGVMPEGMKFPDDSELWGLLIPTDAQLARDARRLGVVGRLKDGVTERQAETEIDGIARRIIAAHPDQTKGVIGGQVETLIERFMGGMARPMFITVMGAVSFVLLIACANVANLLLSRSIYRSREVAIRYSLGATRWRIVRQLLAESVLLSLLGGVIGLGLAVIAVDAWVAALRLAQAPYWLQFVIDYRVLAYVAGVCVLTGVIFGIAPALHVSRDNQHEALKDGGRGNIGNRRAGRFGSGLVVAELALTVVLLCGAGLMVRSFVTLYTLAPGFEVDGLVRMRMQLPPAKYPTADARARFFAQLQPRLDAIPGVTGSAIATSVPPSTDAEWRVEIDGRPPIDDARRPFVATVTITPGYFEVLRAGIARGRALTSADGAPGSEHVVISAAMAERHFAGEDPVGRRIRFVPREDEREPPQPWRTIVGVSAPFLQGDTAEAFRSSVVYLPHRQNTPRTSSILIRSPLPPAQVLSAVQQAVQAVDSDQPVLAIETVAAAMANEQLFHNIFSWVFGLLASIGLLLSAVGVYGVMAYAVTQRTQEIGVRMAIGAGRRHVSWIFLKRCLWQLALGLAIGLPGALALGQIISFNLVEIEPSDPVTIIGITVAVVVVALASCLIPVRKASRVDPVIALRAD